MDINYDEWRAIGLRNGWAGPAVCSTHDGIPMSADEEDEFEDGDPCIHVMRMYDSPEHKLAVEVNHAPSQWRI